MTTPKKRLTVANNLVVTMEYTLKVDGEVIEDTQESEPIQFLQGAGQVLPALEGQLYGMSVGESKELTLQPEEGYGLVDEEAISDYDRNEFPKDIPLQPGVELELKDQDGDTHFARVVAVDDNHVRLDFNPVLAGKSLQFNIRIVALRNATAEEIEHGHAH
jgi:FKBP-type peptidyl-prolyl cis-trans isomerase SlyD